MSAYSLYRRNLETLINIKRFDSISYKDSSLYIDDRYLKTWRKQTNLDELLDIIKTSFIQIINLLVLPKIKMSESCQDLDKLSKYEYCSNIINYLKKCLQGIDRMKDYYVTYTNNQEISIEKIDNIYNELNSLIEKYQKIIEILEEKQADRFDYLSLAQLEKIVDRYQNKITTIDNVDLTQIEEGLVIDILNKSDNINTTQNTIESNTTIDSSESPISESNNEPLLETSNELENNSTNDSTNESGNESDANESENELSNNSVANESGNESGNESVANESGNESVNNSRNELSNNSDGNESVANESGNESGNELSNDSDTSEYISDSSEDETDPEYNYFYNIYSTVGLETLVNTVWNWWSYYYNSLTEYLFN